MTSEIFSPMSDKNSGGRVRIIFFGLGSIGRSHAKLISDNFKHTIYAFRSDKTKRENDFGIRELNSLKEVEKLKPSVAFITCPTSKHVKYAKFCAEHKINLFIEKPLSHDKKGLQELAKAIKKSRIKSYTAYCLRFHPVIQWLKKYTAEKKPLHVRVQVSSYLPNWRKGSSLSDYSAHKRMGGGVILDLSHEIDYLYFLFGEPKNIKVNAKKISDVTVDAEDFADILMEMGNIYCNLHLNFMSRLKRREMILDFKENTIVVDLVNNKIKIIGNKKEETREITFHGDMDKVYLSQLKYFFTSKKNMNNIDESIQVFNTIAKIKEEIK